MNSQEMPQEPTAGGETVSLELLTTSTHSIGSGSYVLIGRDQQGEFRRAVVDGKFLPKPPVAGETWALSGRMRTHPVHGDQLHAASALPLMPEGHAIVRFLATDRRFQGVGWTTARRIWEVFGNKVYDILADANIAALSDVVGPERAMTIAAGFSGFAEEVEVFRTLDRYGVAARTAGAAARLWGGDAVARIRRDPYALTLFEPWAAVDARALRLGVHPGDSRRAASVLVHVLELAFRKGDMFRDQQYCVELARKMLLPFEVEKSEIVKCAVCTGEIVHPGKSSIQLLGCHFMEREIERLLALRINRQPRNVSGSTIAAILQQIEQSTEHTLTYEQREAVFMAASCGVSIITGGAGTGKTTVLRAVLQTIEALWEEDQDQSQSRRHYQLTVAGRAAKRMSIATQREAWTISRFHRETESAGRRPTRGLVIFDESSMIDTPSLYRVLSQLPDEIDLLFIGNTGQLPPIGPGRPFHKMVDAQVFPKVVLDQVQRQEASSGIPAVTASIRVGTLPVLPRLDFNQPCRSGVFIVPGDSATTQTNVLKVFRAMAGVPPAEGMTSRLYDRDIQILCQTKLGPVGSNALNGMIEAEYMKNQREIEGWGLRSGSKILWLRNDYEKAPLKDSSGAWLYDALTGRRKYAGFMNGSLGVIDTSSGKPSVTLDDGACDIISSGDLVKLTHGWSISVHKAQGSAFRHVIIPVVESRLADRSMIYTAITRAVTTAVLVGEPDLIRKIVEAAPSSLKRNCGLRFL